MKDELTADQINFLKEEFGVDEKNYISCLTIRSMSFMRKSAM